jgi:formylglycine-generating enzyme required for sulfatase activity
MRASWLLWIALIGACGYPNPAGSGSGDAPTRDDSARVGDATGSYGHSMQSCANLQPNCGPTSSASCCANSLVPGGTFYRSYDVGGDMAWANMSFPATVSDFRLDTYEVTVSRFREFVNAGMGTQASPPPAGAGARTLNGMANQGGWDPSWNSSLMSNTATLVGELSCNGMQETWLGGLPGPYEQDPINCITWFEAFAFCVWDGGFLPTEAQWNYAAAGGSDQRAYPWSSPPSAVDTINCAHANYFAGAPMGAYCVPNGTIGAVNPVGSESPAGDGKYGQADLAGNVWEWTLDSFQTPYTQPCTDCADLSVVSEQVVRGGAALNDSALLRSAKRSFGLATLGNPTRYPGTGVRCARAP